MTPHFYLSMIFLVVNIVPADAADDGISGYGWCKYFPGGCDSEYWVPVIIWIAVWAGVMVVGLAVSICVEKSTGVNNNRTKLICGLTCSLTWPCCLPIVFVWYLIKIKKCCAKETESPKDNETEKRPASDEKLSNV